MRARTIAISALIIGGLLVLVAVIALHPATESTTPHKYLVTNVDGTCYVEDANGSVMTSGTDAAAVINKALASLTPGRTARETVLLDGDFTLDSKIEVPSHTTLEVAEGGSLTGADGTSTFLLYAVSGVDIEIVGGEWDGNRANRELAGNTVMAFIDCYNVSLSGVNAHDAPYDAIAFDSCSWVTISGTEIGKVGHTALVMGNCSNCTLENSHIYDCGGGGCYFLCEEGVPECTLMDNALRNNTVERTHLTGLSIASLREPQHRGGNSIAENNTLIDCGLDGYHPGIACGWGDNKATNCTIRFNTVYETKAFWPPHGNGTNGGIAVISTDSRIYSNVVRDTYDFGIEVSGDSNTVEGNEISGSQTSVYGGMVCDDLNHSKVENNTVRDCPTGIRLAGSCSENWMANNSFEDIAYYSIVIEGPDSVGNTIEENSYVRSGGVVDEGTETVIGNDGLSGLSSQVPFGSRVEAPRSVR